MAHFKRFMFEFENCMYFTFFCEFHHKDVIERIASDHNIHISYPSTSSKTNIDEVDRMQDILQNNLKLFFHPSSPPCENLMNVMEINGFKLIHALQDRWIFHKVAT